MYYLLILRCVIKGPSTVNARVSLGKSSDLLEEGYIQCVSFQILEIAVICRSGPYFQQGCRIQSQKAQRPTFCGRQGQGAKLASSLRSLAFKKKLMIA